MLRYLALTAAAALLVVLFRSLIPANQTTVALAFLILMLLTASRWRLAYSVYVSILCTFLYNFFFLPPVGRLTITAPSNWVALGAFLCTSVLVSHLSNKERRQAETSEARRLELEQLYEFSGPGIEPDDQPFVFDKFFRGKRRQTAIGGTGMGLAIVKAILQAHAGGIKVLSRPEEGSSFTLWLPLTGA